MSQASLDPAHASEAVSIYYGGREERKQEQDRYSTFPRPYKDIMAPGLPRNTDPQEEEEAESSMVEDFEMSMEEDHASVPEIDMPVRQHTRTKPWARCGAACFGAISLLCLILFACLYQWARHPKEVATIEHLNVVTGLQLWSHVDVGHLNRAAKRLSILADQTSELPDIKAPLRTAMELLKTVSDIENSLAITISALEATRGLLEQRYHQVLQPERSEGPSRFEFILHARRIRGLDALHLPLERLFRECVSTLDTARQQTGLRQYQLDSVMPQLCADVASFPDEELWTEDYISKYGAQVMPSNADILKIKHTWLCAVWHNRKQSTAEASNIRTSNIAMLRAEQVHKHTETLREARNIASWEIDSVCSGRCRFALGAYQCGDALKSLFWLCWDFVAAWVMQTTGSIVLWWGRIVKKVTRSVHSFWFFQD